MAPPTDNIDGVPGMMMDVKNSDMDLFNPVADLQPGMPEGQDFVKKDTPASEHLNKFVTDTNLGLEAYTNTAKAEAKNYMTSDDIAAATIKNVVNDIYA